MLIYMITFTCLLSAVLYAINIKLQETKLTVAVIALATISYLLTILWTVDFYKNKNEVILNETSTTNLDERRL